MGKINKKHLPEQEESIKEGEGRTLDPQDLVKNNNPREIVENPAVAPQMIDQAPEDLRGDLFKDE